MELIFALMGEVEKHTLPGTDCRECMAEIIRLSRETPEGRDMLSILLA